MKIIPILLIIIPFVLGCSEKAPVGEEKLILIYTDLMFAQDTVLINSKNIDSLKTEVFNRHNITEDQYQKTLEFYNKFPQRWEMFFDKVIEYVESLKTKPDET
jgi:hypothetical protein